jgi:hypothetical protein
VYEPGELLAIAHTGDTETGRHLLRTAADPVLLRAEADRPVRVEVLGQGVLLGFGSRARSSSTGTARPARATAWHTT